MTKDNFNFKFVDNFNTSDILNHLNTLEQDWLDVPKDSPSFQAYRETQGIPVIQIESITEENISIKTFENLQNEKLKELTKSIVNDLAEKYNSRIIRTLFIKIPSYRKTFPNFDSEIDQPFATKFYRFYIIIDTDDSIYFKVGKDLKRFNIGECWEINNTIINSIWNISLSKDLIYLVADFLPEEYFKE